ncbi:MAG TPA: uroporphyrinogen decarboxylase family protein [Clostridiaceae bacterium]
METMTGRERVSKTINHEKTDRMPIDLGMHFSTGISVFAYKALRDYLGLSTNNIHIADSVQMLARVDEDILERFHCDCMLLNPPWEKPVKWTVRGDNTFWVSDKFNPKLNEKGDWRVSSGKKSMRLPQGGYFFDGEWLSTNEYSSQEERLKAYAKRAEWLFKETDYFTMEMGFSGFFGGIEEACDMYTDPEIVIENQKILLKDNLKRVKALISSYGQYIQCIEVNSDLGGQSNPFIKSEMYEEFCLPYLKEFCEFVHRNSDIKIFIHSCGSMKPLIPYLIDAGINIINPVQVSASNMDPKALKTEFGDKICFWGGGCETQSTLPLGTVKDVVNNVKELISVFKPNGGYVFNQVHNIMGDIKPEKIVAMFDTAYKNSFY